MGGFAQPPSRIADLVPARPDLDGFCAVIVDGATPRDATVGGGSYRNGLVCVGGIWKVAFSDGHAYGGIYCVYNTVVTTITAANTPVQMTGFDTNSPFDGCTPDHTQDHITIDQAADYQILSSNTVESVQSGGATVRAAVMTNNGTAIVGSMVMEGETSGSAGGTGQFTLSGIASLAAGDTVELWIENLTDAKNFLLKHASLSVTMVS